MDEFAVRCFALSFGWCFYFQLVTLSAGNVGTIECYWSLPPRIARLSARSWYRFLHNAHDQWSEKKGCSCLAVDSITFGNWIFQVLTKKNNIRAPDLACIKTNMLIGFWMLLVSFLFNTERQVILRSCLLLDIRKCIVLAKFIQIPYRIDISFKASLNSSNQVDQRLIPGCRFTPQLLWRWSSEWPKGGYRARRDSNILQNAVFSVNEMAVNVHMIYHPRVG